MRKPVKTDAQPLPAAKRPLALLPAAQYVTPYLIYVPSGTVVEQVCEPTFWANVAKKMRPGDKVEVMPNDMAWWAMLIVRAAGGLEAVVQVLQFETLGHAEVAARETPYEVRFVNAERKWGVFLRDGGDLVRDEFQVKEHAEKYMANHAKTMAA